MSEEHTADYPLSHTGIESSTAQDFICLDGQGVSRVKPGVMAERTRSDKTHNQDNTLYTLGARAHSDGLLHALVYK